MKNTLGRRRIEKEILRSAQGGEDGKKEREREGEGGDMHKMTESSCSISHKTVQNLWSTQRARDAKGVQLAGR